MGDWEVWKKCISSGLPAIDSLRSARFRSCVCLDFFVQPSAQFVGEKTAFKHLRCEFGMTVAHRVTSGCMCCRMCCFSATLAGLRQEGSGDSHFDGHDLL